jgi:lactobin A/cerein 7B family class IIb bacteriocin
MIVTSDISVRELDSSETESVSGGVAFLVAAAGIGIFGTGFAIGWSVGMSRWPQLR